MIVSNFFSLKKHSGQLAALGVIFLLSFFSLRVISEINRKSVTIDEFIHLPAGYYYLRTGDFKLLRYHAPFIQMISAVPMLFEDIVFSDGLAWKNVNDWSFGYEFMWTNSASYQKIFTTSRYVILLIALGFGIFIYRWTRELFGRKAGLFALFLFSFSPDILAHSGLVTLDVGVSFFFFITIYFLWKFTENSKIKYGLLSGLTLGLAVISKYSALMAIPLIGIISFLVVIFRRKAFTQVKVGRYLISIFLLLAVGWLVINAAYGFKDSLTPLGKYHFQSKVLRPFNNNIFSGVPAPLPFHFLKGFDEQLGIQQGRFDSYLCGGVSDSSWWYYYIFAFVFKEPVALIILLLLTSLSFWMLGKKRYEVVIFVLFPAAYLFTIVSLMSVNIGIRYILPVFPFLFLFIGNVVNINLLEIFVRKKFILLILILCSAWYAGASVKIHPHYLSYFNEIVGGPGKGYQYLIDSNIDWGQDLIGLKKFLDENKIGKVSLAYFGRVDPALYGISFDLLTDRSVKGPCAVSVSYLAGRPYVIYKDKRLYYAGPYFYTWLSNYQPIARIGNSIYFYWIDGKR